MYENLIGQRVTIKFLDKSKNKVDGILDEEKWPMIAGHYTLNGTKFTFNITALLSVLEWKKRNEE